MRKLQYIGKLKKTDIAAERLGIGFEKLDRAVFEPERAYEKLGEIGIKWVRLQSGWARTEKEPGVYDFTWLDDIVDNLSMPQNWGISPSKPPRHCKLAIRMYM